MAEQRVDLGAQESRHALQVLRLREGDPVQLLNGEGELAEAVIDVMDRDRAIALVTGVRTRPRNVLEVTLAMGLSKPKAMEVVVQKGVELGLDKILIVACARSVSRLNPHELAQKVGKWRTTAIEALKQCGGFWLPRIEVFPSVWACLDRGETVESRWVGALTGTPRHPREWLDQAARDTGRFPRKYQRGAEIGAPRIPRLWLCG